ncbi:hypothetical protein H0X32_02625 [Patescibacteria group bacterium]|nr:hypothetical protein [Patescibacteria group bacterium]
MADEPEKKHVHIIGLCGVGMSATALLLKESGYTVSGSDAECYGPPKNILERAGLFPILGYAPENIPAETDLFVVGRNAKLAYDDNAEVRAAFEFGKPIRSFPEILGDITTGRENLVVAGSYGKSSTTALIAFILRHAGVDAGYFIGAEPVSLPHPSGLGTHPVFVLEGDEYPSGHKDPQAKFMHLHPRDVILTSVVHDHVNIYPTFEEYQKPFRDLLALVPPEGLVIVSADEPRALEMAEESRKKIVTYGVYHGMYSARDIEIGERTHFILTKDDEPVIEIETTLLGKHNFENIVGASTYLLSRELVTPEALRSAVAVFGGVRRRLDNIALTSKVPIFEGFGSSYEKARAAIDALRLHFGTRRLVIVFEPHTFSWRNRANLSWYDKVFGGADLAFIAPPETQGSDTHEQLSGDEIMNRLSGSGIDVLLYDPTHPEAVLSHLTENDVILVLTSGDLEGSLESFARCVSQHFPL